jgi:NitT/TauT family transport system substrate-binding protein
VIRPLFRIPLAAAVVALLAAGCASADGAAAPSGLEKTNLVVYAVPAADSAGVYIAEQDGLFAAEGLHVKIYAAISSATVIAGQLAGKIDVTAGAYPSYIAANAMDHADFEILAAGSIMQPRNQEIMVTAGSPIRSIQDLKGKTIAINAPDNILQMLVSALLRDNGVPVKDVHFVSNIPFPLMTKVLQLHEDIAPGPDHGRHVDAVSLPEPFVTGAEESIGAEPLADEDAGAAQNLPISGFVVTKQWAHKYPRTAAAFLKALQEAQRIADTNPKAVEQALVKYVPGLSATQAAVMAVPSFPLNTDPALIQRVADLMTQFGFLPPQGYKVDQMIYRP